MIKTIPLGFACLLLLSQLKAQTDTTMTTTDTNVVADKTMTDTIQPFSLTAEKISIKKQPVYKLKPIVDFPLTVINSAWTLYAFTKIYHKPATDAEVVLGLNKNDINWFDRWAVRPYSPRLDKIAYIPFNAAMPLPLFFLIPKNPQGFFQTDFSLFGSDVDHWFIIFRIYLPSRPISALRI
jgi:hypothetical protein